MPIVRGSKPAAAKAVVAVDWEAVDRMTDEDIAGQIAEDADVAPDLAPEIDVAAIRRRRV